MIGFRTTSQAGTPVSLILALSSILTVSVVSPVLFGFDVLEDPAATQGSSAGQTVDSPEAVWEQVKRDSNTAWEEASETSRRAWESARDGSTRLWNQATDEETWRKAQADSEELWLKAKQESQSAWERAAESSQRAWESTRDFTLKGWEGAKSSVSGAAKGSAPASPAQ